MFTKKLLRKRLLKAFNRHIGKPNTSWKETSEKGRLRFPLKAQTEVSLLFLTKIKHKKAFFLLPKKEEFTVALPPRYPLPPGNFLATSLFPSRFSAQSSVHAVYSEKKVFSE